MLAAMYPLKAVHFYSLRVFHHKHLQHHEFTFHLRLCSLPLPLEPSASVAEDKQQPLPWLYCGIAGIIPLLGQ
ncbi:hypothetical protein Tco_0576933, partial [Tanacetum coccineum]